MDSSPVELYKAENWLIAKVAGQDDYRFGAYIERLDKRSMWRISEGVDLSATFEELLELHSLIGRVLSGEAGEPYPAKVPLGERFEAVFGPDSNHPIERNEKTFEGYDFEPLDAPPAQKDQAGTPGGEA